MQITKKIFCLLSLTIGIYSLSAQPELTMEPYATGFDIPVGISNAGDERLFILEKEGLIKIIDSDAFTVPIPFLDINKQVNSGSSERGLLGLVFHPDFKTNGYFYINYTNLDGNTVISRYSVDQADPDRANPDSEKIILQVEQPFNNHNGGDLHFGPDGFLYIGLGDGGAAGDPQNFAQNPRSLLGKMLRIDVNTNSEAIPYTIPDDNPFVNNPNVLDEIWALGLRNPWRFSFDSATGDLWIGDVGQNNTEEVNFMPSSSRGGENYGWRCFEGDKAFNTSGCQNQDNYVFPIHVYRHISDDGCGGSVTGGFVYRGTQYPGLNGYYIYADYCTGTVSAILQDQFGGFINSDLMKYTNNQLVALGQGDSGQLYVAAVQDGIIFTLNGNVVNSARQVLEFDSFTVAPNPFQDQLTLRFSTKATGDFQLSLLNLDGKIIHSSTERFSQNFSKILNWESLPVGTYFLEISQQNKKYTQRIIKQN